MGLEGISFKQDVNTKLQTLFKAAVMTAKEEVKDINIFDKNHDGKFEKAEVTNAITQIAKKNEKTISEDKYTGVQNGVENSDELKGLYKDVANMDFYDWTGRNGDNQRDERIGQVENNQRDAAASTRVMIDAAVKSGALESEEFSAVDGPAKPDEPKPTAGPGLKVQVDEDTYIEAPANATVDVVEGTGEDEGKTIYKVTIPDSKDGKGARVQINDKSYVDVPAGYEVTVIHDDKTGKDVVKIVPLKDNQETENVTDDKKTEEEKPEDVKPEDVKPEDVKPEDPKPEDVKPEEHSAEVTDIAFEAFMELDGSGYEMQYDTDGNGVLDANEKETAITNFLNEHKEDIKAAKFTGADEQAKNSGSEIRAFGKLANAGAYDWGSDEVKNQRIQDVQTNKRDAKKAILRILAEIFHINLNIGEPSEKTPEETPKEEERKYLD